MAKAVVTKDDVVQLSPTQQTIRDALTAMASDNADTAERIMNNLLATNSVDELFEQLERGTVHARDILNVPLTVRGVTLNASSFGSGPDAYCVLEVSRIDDGSPVLITCGAGNVLAGMIKLHQFDAFPIDIELVELSETSAGFRPLSFRRYFRPQGF